MKKLVLAITLTIVSFTSAMSQSDSVTVNKYINYMTDKVTWQSSERAFAISDSDRSKGLIIDPVFSTNVKSIRSLIVTPYKLGNCNEDNTLIIKFVDGSKIKLISWNDFDCENTYFDTTKDLESKLRNIEVEKIYYQNGRTYDSGTFPIKTPRYFIQLYKSLSKTNN